MDDFLCNSMAEVGGICNEREIRALHYISTDIQSVAKSYLLEGDYCRSALSCRLNPPFDGGMDAVSSGHCRVCTVRYYYKQSCLHGQKENGSWEGGTAKWVVHALIALSGCVNNVSLSAMGNA